MGLFIKYKGFAPPELDAFRAAQQASYKTLTDFADGLAPGIGEIEATRLLRKAFYVQGVRHFFHVPVALFGERTAYPGDFGAFGALPTDRTLKPGDPVILDAAPIYDGYLVDTSYAFPFGRVAGFDALDGHLEILRAMILAEVNLGHGFRDIARTVDGYIRDHGYENCHKKHIGAVLGHRVIKGRGWLVDQPRIWGLASKHVGWFLAKSLIARAGFKNQTPNWNHGRVCDGVRPHGLWAVEPHLARDGVGAKFEEILVIDEDGAHYLDDALPHLTRWRGRRARTAA